MINYKKLTILQLQAAKKFIEKYELDKNRRNWKLVTKLEEQVSECESLSESQYAVYDKILIAIDNRMCGKTKELIRQKKIK